MLQETYNLNMNLFSKGMVGDKNTFLSRRIDSLHPDDLVLMSTIAIMTFRWYDNSLMYLEEAVNVLYRLSVTERNKWPFTFHSTMLNLTKSYSTAHNKMLNNNRKYIGSDWKSSPFFVKEGLVKYFDGNHLIVLCLYMV